MDNTAMTQLSDVAERVAKALYEDFVADDFTNEYAPWTALPDKDTWRKRARVALSAMSAGE